MIKELLQEKGVEANIVKSMNISQVFASSNERIHSLDQIIKAMDTLTEGEGKEWIPTNMQPRMLERLRLAMRVPGLFETFTITSDKEDLPVEGGDAQAYLVPENTADTGQEGITPSTPGTAAVNFAARTIGAMTRVSKKANRDSIIPLIPYIQFKLLRALAVGRENAIINGDVSVTHQDYGVTGAKDVRKSWQGLRHMAIANGWVVDGADFSADTIFEAIAMMGEYGVESPEDIAIIHSPASYAHFRAFPEMRTQKNAGADDVLVTGQRDNFMGSPVLVSGKMPQNLTADGVISDTPGDNTKTGALLVYRPGFSNADRQEAELDEDPTPKENLQTKVLVDARYDFKPNYKVQSEPIVVFIKNIPTAFGS